MPRSFSAVLGLLATVLIALFLSAGTVYAQSISGIVYDWSGGIVARARVMLMQDYVKMQEMKSSPRGEFSFSGLKPGLYQLQVKQPLFSLFQATVGLEEKTAARIYAVLPPVRLAEEVTIHGSLPAGSQKVPLVEREPRTGGKVEPPEPLSPMRPAYPPGAASRGVEGSVVLFATIKNDGNVDNIVVMESADPELQDEAIRTLKGCRYQPAKLNGQLVDTQMTIAFNFNLK